MVAHPGGYPQSKLPKAPAAAPRGLFLAVAARRRAVARAFGQDQGRRSAHPLDAARPAPSGAGHLSPEGYGTWAPSLNSVLRGADTLLPCSPRPSSSFLLHYLTSVSGKRGYRALSLNPRRARPPATTRAIDDDTLGARPARRLAGRLLPQHIGICGLEPLVALELLLNLQEECARDVLGTGEDADRDLRVPHALLNDTGEGPDRGFVVKPRPQVQVPIR